MQHLKTKLEIRISKSEMVQQAVRQAHGPEQCRRAIQKAKIQMTETNSIRGQYLQGLSLEHWYI